VKRLREALGDSAEHPRFVETLPRRGYRFIYPVEAPGPKRRRRVLVVGLAALAAVALLFALNVGHVRDRLLGRPLPGEITSIAVLPLDNLSGDPEQEYCADGITEALLTELGKISALRVISRQSVMRFKDSAKSLPEIARVLDVDAIVEGAVVREGDQVRITVQVIQVAPERHLWAQSYEQEWRGILALQGEVARTIAREIKVKLTPQEQVRLASARSVNPEAYEAYLKGQYFLAKWTEEGTRKSIEYFLQAIDIDPTYAPAYARLGWAYNNLSFWGHAPPKETLPRVKAAVTRALELDDGLAEAHATLGAIKLSFDWDWLGAERELRRALELNPNSVDALLEHSFYLALMGRFDGAIAANKQAIQLDPLTPTTTISLGWMYYFTRQYDESIRQLEKALELDPNSPYAYMELAWNYADTGKYAEAVAACQKALDLLEEDQVLLGSCGRSYAKSGRRDEAFKLLDQLMEMSASRYVDAYYIASIYDGLGETHRTLDWLERAYEQHSPSMIFLKIEPFTDGVRDDPRFQDLLRRMNFPE
jgi:TolB-like protein/Tfp pilus assembly protein PilF